MSHLGCISMHRTWHNKLFEVYIGKSEKSPHQQFQGSNEYKPQDYWFPAMGLRTRVGENFSGIVFEAGIFLDNYL